MSKIGTSLTFVYIILQGVFNLKAISYKVAVLL